MLCGTAAYAQLRLVAGSAPFAATDGYPFTIYTLSNAGEFKPELKPLSGNDTAAWVGYSAEWSTLVVVTSKILVVDLREPSIAKECVEPSRPGLVPIQRWLLDVPGQGPTVAEYLHNVESQRGEILGMSLGRSMPCEKSFSGINIVDMKRLQIEGNGGLAGEVYAPSGVAQLGIDTDGRLRRWFPDVGTVYFDPQLPQAMLDGLTDPIASVALDTSQIFALDIGDYGKPTSFRLAVFRKSDSTWHRMPAGLGYSAWSRAFGPYLALAENHPKTSTTDQSAGSDGWRAASTRIGISMRPLFEQSRDVFPGRLHIYDTRNERLYTIDTKQGDSEVVLIQNGIIYYRASDKLYSVSITENGLGASKLLAASDTIRDVHWVFVER